MATAFFEDLADALGGMLPREFGDFSIRRTGRNLKVWYGDDRWQHYEVQLLRDGAVEIGFHSEHSTVARNDEVVARLSKSERKWRRALGKEAELGEFLGPPAPVWRRLSEVWLDLGELDAEAAMEVADRLCCYVRVLMPLVSPALRSGSLGAEPLTR